MLDRKGYNLRNTTVRLTNIHGCMVIVTDIDKRHSRPAISGFLNQSIITYVHPKGLLPIYPRYRSVELEPSREWYFATISPCSYTFRQVNLDPASPSTGELNLSDYMLRPRILLEPELMLIYFGAGDNFCWRGQSTISNIAF